MICKPKIREKLQFKKKGIALLRVFNSNLPKSADTNTWQYTVFTVEFSFNNN